MCAVGKAFVDVIFTHRRRFERQFLPDLWGQIDGITLHSDSLPWWLLDMRPQGFLGRAYAARYAEMLGLPARLADWSDAQALRALTAHGLDAVGNLLLGDMARTRFLDAPPPAPILDGMKGQTYARLAREAARGDNPASSAGGEQPKFTTFAHTATGPRHVLVKFTLLDANPVTPCVDALARHIDDAGAKVSRLG